MRKSSRVQDIRLFLPIAALIAASAAIASESSTFTSGHETALNAITDGRSGRHWTQGPLEPSAAGGPWAMEETIVPAAGRTDIVHITPGAIIPCVRVITATDAIGSTSYDLAVDAANVNRDFLVSDIHTGEPLQFCAATIRAVPTFPPVAAPAPAPTGGLNKGHTQALNALCGGGRSGRSWSLDAAGASTETIVPAPGRTDVVRIMPGAIVPCVRIRVITDDAGLTRYELAVDAENVNRSFQITDIHTGEALQVCGRPR